MSFNSSRSAESGSKSKRSFNSTSSNRPDNSNNSDTSKKKKTTQKTLGMAWGSNSRSSSRSSFMNSPFSGFGSYMAVKNQKLQEQFEAEATSFSNGDSNKGKPIFQGVSIFVDGFTVPSNQELKEYMLKHGGRFENYFSRHRVTHIICSNLPDSKIKNLRSFSAGLPVVKPAWLLDSVATNKLLSWVPYQLDQVASETNNQPKLLSFFALKSSSISNDYRTCVTGQVKSEIEDPSLKSCAIKEPDLSGPCTEHLRPCSIDWEESVHGNITSVIEEPTCNSGQYSEGSLAKPSNDLAIVKASVVDLDQDSPSRPSASVNSNNAKNSTSSAIAGPSKRHHSTLVDPKFVENYFKKSRLHFIGTWRSRYRKRFPSSTHTSSNVNASVQRTSVIHVDMDSFFVSVVIRNHPELRDKPVAVCHSDNPRGTAEISSANYPAREYGVRAGIFVRDAKALCPHLTIFPYDFDAYEEVADQFYNILHKHCNKVQAVSCDEAFLEVRDLEVEDPQFFASLIRKEIFETTGCTASAGISENLLMARLATKAAKPDGQYYIRAEKVDDYLNELPIKLLPGIGHVLEEKLKGREIHTCGQLRMISKESLQKEFGVKTGDMLWNFSRGVDNRLVGVIQENKSVGAEVNWGVRFNDMKDCQHFLVNLCNEVSLRLQGCAVEGRSFTLKIKKRRSAEEPVKYMGCGDCENLSHSITVPMATDDVDIMRRITTQLFGLFHIDVQDIRGMGLQVSKLESVDTAKQGHERNSIRSWLASASASTKEQRGTSFPAEKSASREFENEHIDKNLGRFSTDLVGPSGQIGTNSANSEAPSNQDLALPALGDLDLGVVESLPPDLFSEINDIYHGKLINLISKKKGKSVAQERVQVAIKEGSRLFWHDPTRVNENPVVDKEENYPADKFEAGPSNVGISTVVLNKNDLMPSSLSQVDASVLQQLPEELRVDILQLFPAHRQPECVPDVYLDPSSKSKELLCLKSPENQPSDSSKELWAGNPPGWVVMFIHSNCWIMQILADMYYKSGSTGQLSSILQCTFSESQLLVDPSNDGWDDAIGCLCDLLKQYIKLRVETDIEEIYVCFRLLRRFTTKSKLFSQVYSVVFPHLQASVGENYGGSLHI